MKNEKSMAFECPLCHGGEKKKRIYIPVDFGGDKVECPNCHENVSVAPEWKAQLEMFKHIPPLS